MTNKILKILIIVLGILAFTFWYQKGQAEKREFQTQQQLRKKTIAEDSIKKVSDGYYQKLVADTLTSKELKRLAERIVDLENREPVSVTKTVIQPVKIIKETDSITREGDSISITDFYPNKVNPFLKYTNNFSLVTNKGNSFFDWNPITLTEVVTKKNDGLYQIDFLAPEFIKVNSIDIQTEPMAKPIPDNWGTVIGIEYGKNLETKTNVFEINAYQRYKKIYFGGAISTNKDLKGGIKFEF